MEEADLLSDRCVVMVDGSFKCIGTALYLKNEFGDGYRISLTTNHNEIVKKLMLALVPGIEIFDESGENIMFSVGLDNLNAIIKFFQLMERNNHDPELPPECLQLPDLIDDWGLSHTTLEEVFMRVTGKKEDTSAEPSTGTATPNLQT
jgi:ABC-type multidrug transport system ATPase subunit